MVCIGKNTANYSKKPQFLPVMCALCGLCLRCAGCACAVRALCTHAPYEPMPPERVYQTIPPSYPGQRHPETLRWRLQISAGAVESYAKGLLLGTQELKHG